VNETVALVNDEAPILSSSALTMKFGEFPALQGVDVSVRRGQIFGLIGPNGSGKSTWINCVSGVYRPTSGRVTFAGADVTGKPSHRMYAAGLARTFQRLENFPAMSVMENMLLGIQEKRGSLASRLLKHSEREEREKAESLLDFMGIVGVRNEPVRNLSYGQQKLCDLAMALMADPDVVLLDEPMAGINPALVDQLVQRIQALNASGKTFVIIEHNMKVVMQLCDWIVVFDHGTKLAEGLPRDIQHNADVLEAYFGA
jgi:neutral amino acid transport system ATP-binding protein